MWQNARKIQCNPNMMIKYKVYKCAHTNLFEISEKFEIHNLQVWLLTSNYTYRSMVQMLKEIKVCMAALVLFGDVQEKVAMCLLCSPVCINNLRTDECIFLTFDIKVL